MYGVFVVTSLVCQNSHFAHEAAERCASGVSCALMIEGSGRGETTARPRLK